MNATSYVKKFGHLSFKEKPFNNVDAGVLTYAVFGNLEMIVPSIYENNPKNTLIQNINDYDLSIVVSGKQLINIKKLITYMRTSKRYSSIGMNYLMKKSIETNDTHFYACTFFIPDVGTFISFRGTDASMADWKEDLSLSICDVVPSQVEALKYVNKIASKTEGPLFIGGHSKGGNLSLYCSYNLTPKIADRIVHIYSLDGNGLKNKSYYNTKGYLNIKDKIVFIRPFCSYVGEIMYNPKTFLVVASRSFSIMQHDLLKWKVSKKTGDFIYLPRANRGSLIRHWALKEWLNLVEDEDKAFLIDYIVRIGGGITKTIFDTALNIKFFRSFITSHTGLSKKDKKRVKDALNCYVACHRRARNRYKILQKDLKKSKK